MFDPLIVIKNTVFRYQETPLNLTWASAALLHHLFTRRVMGGIAHAGSVRHGWNGEEHAPANGRTCGCSHLPFWSGCASTIGNAESLTTTRSMIPRPLVERELAGLLLNPEQVNVAMGTAGMTVTSTQTSMSDNSATMAPAECLAIDGAAEAPVYADSGFRAERDQSLNNGDNFTHYLKQAVVLFPTMEKADAFLDASAEQWPVCSEYTHTQSGSQWSSDRSPTLTAHWERLRLNRMPVLPAGAVDARWRSGTTSSSTSTRAAPTPATRRSRSPNSSLPM